jgi:glutamine cyclotransferase
MIGFLFRRRAGIAIAMPALWLSAVGARQTPAPPDIPVLTATIVARYPHDRAAFTEGLAWANGALYESTGLEGRSEVRRVSLDGRVTARATIDPKQFGEGLAIWRNQVITLTWHDGLAHRWNARTLKRVGTARYAGDGWGLAAQGNTLAMTDGSATIKFFDAATFRETRRVTATLRGKPLPEVNELEYVDGALLANVWHTPFLVRIDTESGKVTAIVDLRPIVAEIAATDPEAVANGVAWDAQKRRLFVTGKLWPTVFEIKIG